MEEGKDEHDCNKMKEGINETNVVLTQCKPKIENAIDDLENCMATYEEGDKEMFAALQECDEWNQATALIAEAKAFVDAIEI